MSYFTVKIVSDHTRFETYDMSLVIFSGYGEKDELILPDANIGLNDLWQSFLGDKCPELLQKPKVVIISVSLNKEIQFYSRADLAN